MNWLKDIFDFYINASIHVAFAVVCLLQISGEILNISVSIPLIGFVFFATICTYNVLKNGLSVLYRWLHKPKSNMATSLMSMVAFLAALYLSFYLPIGAWILLALILILVILYVIPFRPNDRNFRSLGILKIILVAIIWTAVSVILPMLSSGLDYHWDILVLNIQRFLLVIALIIPFEIRDMPFDPPGIRTLPRRIGIRQTKKLGVLLALLTYLLVYLKDEVTLWEEFSRLILVIALSVIMLKTPVTGNRYYASFWVESIPVFWLGLLLILKGSF